MEEQTGPNWLKHPFPSKNCDDDQGSPGVSVGNELVKLDVTSQFTSKALAEIAAYCDLLSVCISINENFTFWILVWNRIRKPVNCLELSNVGKL
jgi:hypothetical protein